ncbi:hypothetical protein IQ06DRAFT_178693, partial [Phaeosphaeriaceae sp. SRC1lsM3a]
YYSDSEPDFSFRRRPSISQPLVSGPAKLQDPHLECKRNLGWNIDWATAFLVDHIAKKHDAADSLKNIRIKATNLAREGLATDIPFRVSNKLSETLFAGHLNNAVHLNTRSLDSDVSGATYTQSWGPVPSVKRVSIVLNSDVLAFARARDVVAILIHHMIHAFFLIACGPQKEDEVSYGRLGHGFHFGMVMYAIRELSAVSGKELDSLDFGHPFAESRCRRRGGSGAEEESEKWYCSHCHAHVPALSQGQVEAWYQKYIAPIHVQSSKAVRLATVQVYNERRCELKIENRASVLRAILATKSRYLKLESKDVSSSSFEKFIEFLSTGEWRPVMLQTRLSSSGAPVIACSHGLSTAASPTPILDDIYMAKSIPFSETRAYALSRLHAYETCIEDPIAILDAVYTGREPHYALKEWGKLFLSKRDTQSVMNMQKLRTSPAFTDLMERCGGLENEVRKLLEHGNVSSNLDYGGLGISMQIKLLEQSPVMSLGIALHNPSHDHLRRLAPERDHDRLRDTQAQIHAAAMLDRFYGRGLGGFVEDGE